MSINKSAELIKLMLYKPNLLANIIEQEQISTKEYIELFTHLCQNEMYDTMMLMMFMLNHDKNISCVIDKLNSNALLNYFKNVGEARVCREIIDELDQLDIVAEQVSQKGVLFY